MCLLPSDEVQTEEAQIAEPTDQPAEAGDGEGAQAPAVPTLSDVLNAETAKEAFQSPLIQEQVQEQVRRAEQRAKDRTLADQRKRFNDPEVVKRELKSIAQSAGVDVSVLDDAVLSRGAQNLSAALRAASADGIAGEIPGAFFGQYEYTQEQLSDYHEHLAAGRPDEAYQTLVDGAVASRERTLEASFDERVKDAAAKTAQAEIDNQTTSENGTAPIPATTQGNAAPNTGASLTSAELNKIGGNHWSRLSDELKQTLFANVPSADAERGADSVDTGRVEGVRALAQ